MTIDVKIYFNFRSPYCYLLSKNLQEFIDEFDVNLLWRPLGGWDGRSQPDRVVKKLPLVRQDVARWCARYKIPMNPPPKATDPTKAGAVSILAEENGLLLEYIVETMRVEWAEGKDIGQDETLIEIAKKIGLEPDQVLEASTSAQYIAMLIMNAKEAEDDMVIGVPTIVIEDQIFWGNDRLDFVKEHLLTLGAKK